MISNDINLQLSPTVSNGINKTIQIVTKVHENGSILPDVVWSGIIASVIALAGVAFTAWLNNNNLAKQRDHDAQENARQRINELRKEVYLKVMEEISRANRKMARLATLNPIKESTSGILENFNAVMAQVQIVSLHETSLIARNFSFSYAETSYFLSNSLQKTHEAFRDYESLREWREEKRGELRRIDNEIIIAGESVPKDLAKINALQSSRRSLHNSIVGTDDRFEAASKKLADERREYSKLYREKMAKITDLRVDFVSAIRAELGLSTDKKTYAAQLKSDINRFSQTMDSSSASEPKASS